MPRMVVVAVVAFLSFACGSAEWQPDDGGLTYSVVQTGNSGEHALLTSVTSIDVMSEGSIIVGDWYEGVIVLSPDGSLRKRVVGSGEGPGEFRAVSRVAVLPEDSLFVYDPVLRRVTVFAPDLVTVAYTTTLPHSLSGFPRWVLPVRGGSRLLAAYRPPLIAGARPEENVVDTYLLRLLHKDGSIEEDSVLTIRADEDLVIRAGGAVASVAHPFGRSNTVSLTSDDRLYLGWNADVDIQIWSLGGSRVGGFTGASRGRPITKDEITIAADSIRGILANLPPAIAAGVHDALRATTPDRRPAYEGFVVASNGHVWIGFPSENREHVRWTEHTEVGEAVGSLRLPTATVPWKITHRTLYAVAQDSMGVPRIQVFAIVNEERT